MLTRRSLATALGLALLLAVASASPAVAKAPPVALTALAASPSAVEAGGIVSARAVVSARRGARAVRLRYLLSRDARASRDDRQLGSVSLGRVRRGRSTRRRTTVTIPPSISAGRYHLVGCVAAACRAVPLKIAAAPTGTPPGGAPEPGPAASGDTPQPQPQPSPRRVVPALDHAHAATATIGSAGGTLTTTGADGSSFTLTLPPGALAGDIAITLTPVSSVDGLPLSGGSAAAVDVAPDGLALTKPATLAIDPAQAPAVADQRAFSWHDDGAHEVYLRSLSPTAPIEMQLEHFSGYGVGSGTTTADWTPSRTLDQLQQQTAGILTAERARLLNGEPPDPAVTGQYFTTLEAIYDQRVKPRMQAAEADDQLATSSIQLGYGWAHEAAILDSTQNPDPEIAARTQEIEASVRRILHHAFDKAYEKCMAGAPEYAQRLVGFEHWSQSIGYGLPDGAQKARECLRFELTVDATVDEHASVLTFEEHVLVDRLPIRVDDQDFAGRGSQDLTFPVWTASGSAEGCSLDQAGVESATFQVVSLTMQFNLFTQMDQDGRETDVVLPPDITLKVNPGIPHERYLAHCPKGDTPAIDANLWLLSWSTLHHSRIDGTGVYTFTQLETTGGTSPWAEATFDLTSGMVHQHLELKLNHTPGAP